MERKKKFKFSPYMVVGYRKWGTTLARKATFCNNLEMVEKEVQTGFEKSGSVAVFTWNPIRQSYDLEADWNNSTEY